MLPLETIVLIETFETIPVFGGEVLRQKMLEAQKSNAESKAAKILTYLNKLDPLSLARDVQKSFNTVRSSVSCQVSLMANSGLQAFGSPDKLGNNCGSDQVEDVTPKKSSSAQRLQTSMAPTSFNPAINAMSESISL